MFTTQIVRSNKLYYTTTSSNVTDILSPLRLVKILIDTKLLLDEDDSDKSLPFLNIFV